MDEGDWMGLVGRITNLELDGMDLDWLDEIIIVICNLNPSRRL